MSLARIGNTNNLGHKATAETRAKMSAGHKGCHNAFFGKCHSEETKEKVRLSRVGKPTTLGRKASAETRFRISRACRGISRKSTTRSQTYKALWQNPVWAATRVQRIVAARHIKPNKAEVTLLKLLETLFPNQWKYVGDGAFVVGRLNPDFVNINGRKQIIELFGDYWHKPEEEERRRKVFAEYGFVTLIIWERDLGDVDVVASKITEFNNEYKVCKSRASRSSNASGKCRDFTRSIPIGDKEKVQS